VTDWKPLPGGLASDVRHLVAELRALKDRAGLSLATLGRRTPYSKSSWERYLNGKALPPQHAVTSLGKLADADPARLMALWELANTAWHHHESGDADGARDADDVHDRPSEESTPVTQRAPAAQAGEPTSVRRRFGGRQVIRTVVALAAVVGLSVSLYSVFGRQSGAHTDRDGTVGKAAPTRQLDVNCFADSCAGKNPGQAGCGGDAWTAALSKVAGVYVELRYSDACKAAWSRISWGHPGDIARVVGEGGRTYQNKVHYDTDTFSAMVAAPSPSTAKACVLLTSGVHACTSPGGTQHLTEPPNPPAPTTTSVAASPR
jgi:transcriptional regulator with XRE-family HTH domain